MTVDSCGDCGIDYCHDVHEVAHKLTHEAVNKPQLSITYGKGLDLPLITCKQNWKQNLFWKQLLQFFPIDKGLSTLDKTIVYH